MEPRCKNLFIVWKPYQKNKPKKNFQTVHFFVDEESAIDYMNQLTKENTIYCMGVVKGVRYLEKPTEHGKEKFEISRDKEKGCSRVTYKPLP